MVSEPPPPPTMTPATPRRRRFEPSEDLIPFELMPVAPEILGFWATKAGARTERAWTSLITQLSLIQSDPQGGTDALRAQLQTAIDRAPIKPWMSVTHALWRTYGLRPTQASFSRRQTPEEAALESIAFIKARDAKRAAAAAANSQTLLCEVLA
jgi:hypothetical protein